MYLLTHSRLTDARLPRWPRAEWPEWRGAGSRKRQYWRVGLSVMRRGTLLVVLALLAFILLAAGGSSIGT